MYALNEGIEIQLCVCVCEREREKREEERERKGVRGRVVRGWQGPNNEHRIALIIK